MNLSEDALARQINARPWEPLAGMVKLRCTCCSYWFAAPAADTETSGLRDPAASSGCRIATDKLPSLLSLVPGGFGLGVQVRISDPGGGSVIATMLTLLPPVTVGSSTTKPFEVLSCRCSVSSSELPEKIDSMSFW